MSGKQTIDPDQARGIFLSEAGRLIDKIGQSIEGEPGDVMIVVAAAMMAVFTDGLVKQNEQAGVTLAESEATIHALTIWGLDLARGIDLRVVGRARRAFDGKLRLVQNDEPIAGDDA